MFNMVTGQPGDGKTLYTMATVKKYHDDCKASEDKQLNTRQVHYFGIRRVAETLGWHEIEDPKKWYLLPKGSIIVIDEAQEIFPPMKQGSERPKHYTQFATHRHHGFDLYLITQNAMNVDFRVRSMVNIHWHISRNFGREHATIYRFKEIQNPKDYHAKKEAIKTQWPYPKDVYQLYHSAEIHTHKPTIPWKKLLPLVAGVIAIPLIVVFLFNRLKPPTTEDLAELNGVTDNQQITASNQSQTIQKPPDKLSIEQFKPAFKDIPYSAPAYSHLVQVRDYPRVDGCMEYQIGSSYDCTCNDQHGNKIKVSEQACRNYIEYGYFDFTQPASGQRRQAATRPRLAPRGD